MEDADVSVKRYFRKELLHVNCFATFIFESQNIDYFLGFCHSGPLHYLYFLQCHYLYFFLLGIWVKNGPSKVCGRQPLKKLK